MERLAVFVTDLEQPDLEIERVSRVGTTAVEIANHAKETNADLIVMGTHGRSGLSHALLGSIAEKVIRSAPCPVVTVRSAPEPEI